MKDYFGDDNTTSSSNTSQFNLESYLYGERQGFIQLKNKGEKAALYNDIYDATYKKVMDTINFLIAQTYGEEITPDNRELEVMTVMYFPKDESRITESVLESLGTLAISAQWNMDFEKDEKFEHETIDAYHIFVRHTSSKKSYFNQFKLDVVSLITKLAEKDVDKDTINEIKEVFKDDLERMDIGTYDYHEYTNEDPTEKVDDDFIDPTNELMDISGTKPVLEELTRGMNEEQDVKRNLEKMDNKKKAQNLTATVVSLLDDSIRKAVEETKNSPSNYMAAIGKKMYNAMGDASLEGFEEVGIRQMDSIRRKIRDNIFWSPLTQENPFPIPVSLVNLNKGIQYPLLDRVTPEQFGDGLFWAHYFDQKPTDTYMYAFDFRDAWKYIVGIPLPEDIGNIVSSPDEGFVGNIKSLVMGLSQIVYNQKEQCRYENAIRTLLPQGYASFFEGTEKRKVHTVFGILYDTRDLAPALISNFEYFLSTIHFLPQNAEYEVREEPNTSRQKINMMNHDSFKAKNIKGIVLTGNGSHFSFSICTILTIRFHNKRRHNYARWLCWENAVCRPFPG